MAEKSGPPVILDHNLWGNFTHHYGSDLDHHDVPDGPDRIYMDYNATTPVDPEVIVVVTDALTDAWGNPSSNYLPGLKARDIIYHSRDTIARMVGGKAADIIFTSGGTEANNLVFHTAVEHFRKSKTSAEGGTNSQQLNGRGSLPHIIISNVEHDSIKLTAKHLLKEGKADVTFVPVSKVTARVEVEDVIAAIRPTTCLVSIMLANNETGIIMPIKDICQRVKDVNKQRAASAPRILLHTDAAQAIGKIRVDAHELGVDYITIVGHKFYGPRIGALFVNDPGTTTPVYPLLFGGGQERNFRPGTENTAMIAGLGKAAELVSLNLAEYEAHFLDIRCYLEQKLLAVFGKDKIHFNSHFSGSDILPNTCNFSILGRGLQGRRVLSTCRRLLASVGAACHSDRGDQPSHILLSCGIPYDVATNALRISVGRSTSREDVDIVVEDLRDTVEQLERMN
ncbi:selenocysteine lyase [Megalobrama amblycephala]|uniref:selenocysteine lyase n=1 Tax=Megalobrama amblycephala TaxID=75352 RepID=UPI00201423CC|nr:selenocysteine lyase [Megalobrama amblycephala]XP_048055644.1 selenocysteine lyase [Megalobrama amblycephala]